MTWKYRSFPQPLARPCEIAFGHAPSATKQARVWAVPFAAYQALRMACLPVIEAYLDVDFATEEMPSQVSVASIATRLSRLQCPYFADWVTMLETLAKHVKPERVGMKAALPLAEAVTALRAKTWAPMDATYGDRGDRPLPAHRALLFMRNRIAHGGNLPHDATCDRLLEHYLPVLEDLLQAVGFLAECELRVREGEYDGSFTRVATLRGPGEPEFQELGDDEDWDEVLEHHGVAMKMPDGRVLPMSPLFTQGTASPVGLYDGHYILNAEAGGRSNNRVQQRHVYYLGSGHDRWQDPTAVDALQKRLEQRRVQWRISKEKLAPWTIADTLHYGTESTLGDLRGRKYFPDCHVDREDLDSEWKYFLTADDPAPGDHWSPSNVPGQSQIRKSGLVLVGAAGTGKTAWSCRVVDRLLSEGLQEGTPETSSREGHNLVLFLRGDMIPSREGRNDRLLATLLERMGLRDKDFASFDDLFSHLDRQVRRDRVPGRRLVILLDALNEVAVAPEGCFRESLDLIRAAATHPWVKVLVTIREEFLSVLHGKTGAQEKSVFFGIEPYLYAPKFEDGPVGAHRAPVMDLRPLMEEEAAEAYGRYHQHGLVDRPGCRSPRERLDGATRHLLRNPLLLYVFHQRFGGMEAGVIRGRDDLFRSYVDSLMAEYEGLGDACRRVMDCLEEQGATELTAADADELRREWASGRTPDEARLGFSPVEALLHAGLLRARSRHEGAGFTFVFESVLEYLLYDCWAAREPTLPRPFLDALVERGRRDDWPETFWNAFGFVFGRLLEEGRSSDWPGLVNDCSPISLDAVAKQVWLASAAECGLPSDASAAELATTQAGQIVTEFAATGESWGGDRLVGFGLAAHEASLPEWNEQAAASAAGILQRLVAAGRWELEDDLAGAYSNLGIALKGRGYLDGAIDAHAKARDIWERMVTEGRSEFEDNLARVYSNLGVTLQGQGSLDGSIEAYAKARELLERLVATGRRDIENSLANVYMNLGNVLGDRGDLDGAIEACTKAQEIRERLVSEGRREFENDLASAYCNLGVALKVRGDLDGSIEAYVKAQEVLERLVAAGRRELENNLAGVYTNQGNALSVRGDLDGAVEAYTKAQEIRERLVATGRRELESDLAGVYTSLGSTLRNQGDLDGAIDFYAKAQEIWERLLASGRRELENYLAIVYNNLGLALSDQGDHGRAIEAYTKARAIRERLVASGRRELEDDLASVYYNLGNALDTQGDLDGAIEAYTKARAIRERLVASGRRELEDDLASVYYNLGNALDTQGDLDGAIEAYTKARAIRERLVASGRRELEDDLASVYYYLGVALKVRGDLDGSIEAYAEAQEVLERLVAAGRRELENNLAMVYCNLGVALKVRGDLDGSIEAYAKAQEVLERLVAAGRRELENNLAGVYTNQGNALSVRGDLDGAVEAYTKAQEIRERLVASGH